MFKWIKILFSLLCAFTVFLYFAREMRDINDKDYDPVKANCMKEMMKGSVYDRLFNDTLHKMADPYCTCVSKQLVGVVTKQARLPKDEDIAQSYASCMSSTLISVSLSDIDASSTVEESQVEALCMKTMKAFEADIDEVAVGEFCACQAPKTTTIFNHGYPPAKYTKHIQKVADKCKDNMKTFLYERGGFAAQLNESATEK